MNPVDLYLRQRIRAELPDRFASFADTPSNVYFQNDDGEGRFNTMAVYTSEASSVFLPNGSSPTLIIDYRFVDFVLQLLAAGEIEDEGIRATAAMFAIYDLVLEQSLQAPDHILHSGLLLDYTVSRVSASTHFGWDGTPPLDPGRIEFVSNLVTLHEASHAQLSLHLPTRRETAERFRAEVDHMASFAFAAPGREENEVVAPAARTALSLLDAHKIEDALDHDLEELLCDYLMIDAAAASIIASPGELDRTFTYLGLVFGTLTGIWALGSVKQATAQLFGESEVINADPGLSKSVRSVLAMMVFLRKLGVGLRNAGQNSDQMIIEAWDDTADFEQTCVQTINKIFNSKNTQRLEEIAMVAAATGAAPSNPRASIRALFGWP